MSELAAALAALQADPPRITRRARGQVGTREYKYATLDAIWDAIRPWRLDHGIIWVCCPTLHEGSPALAYRLESTRDGGSITGHYPLTDAHGQALGADITYARRYALCAVLGLLTEDDTDGQAIQPRQRTRAKIPGPEHERLRHGTVEPTPDDRPAERTRSVDNSGDLWTDQPPGEFDIGTPEDRPGSVDSRQLKEMGIQFSKLGIRDPSVRHGMTAEILGPQREGLLSAKQLSQVEALHVIEQLKAKVKAKEAADNE